MDKNLLISFEEYSTIKHNNPYVYSVESQNQFLLYFGAEHKKNPLDPQFELIKEKWNEFLKKIGKSKSVVIFEGIANLDDKTTIEEAIKKYGESGAVVNLAKEAGIPFIRPEPIINYEAEDLLKEFTKDEIFYFYVIRSLSSWLRSADLADFKNFIERIVQRYKTELGWADYNFSFDPTIIRIHAEIFNKNFDLIDKDFISKIVSPMHHKSRINDIARMSTTIRNLEILRTIEDYWQRGYNIFIVYGASHAVMQERAIKNLVVK